MRTRTLEKIKLRNRGIEVKPSCYKANGMVITSFALPKSIMLKFYDLEMEYHHQQTILFREMLTNFNFEQCPVEETWYSEDFDEYLARNQITLSKKYKKNEYKFNSRMLPVKLYKKIKEIALYYNITRSSFIRILIEKFYQDKLGKV